MIMPTPENLFSGLLLGWTKQRLKNRLGFYKTPPEDFPTPISESDSCPLTYEGDSHLMTFAPTGSGKGRGMVIPTLLSYPGSVVVIDPKGENYAVTARRRREMGQKVVVLDPFGRATRGKDPSDRFNVFDIFKLPGTIVDADASMLAWQLAAGHSFSKDPFWDIVGSSFLFGLIAHVATAFEEPERNLNRVLKYLYADDVIYSLAVLLDSKTVKCPHARREIAAFLQLPDRDTRPSVLATALSWVKSLNTQCVEATLESSTFNLNDLLDGTPISIYLCIPPDKLTSHKALLRMWIAALLTTVLRRSECPSQKTLFILDECAQLGTMPLLEQAVTLLRGYGLQVWTFWQDMEQVRFNYPNRHETLINNASVLQAFGISNSRMAGQLTEILDCSRSDLLAMKNEELRVFIKGQGSQTCQLPDYLNDQSFGGLWDRNPFFAINPSSR
ncbi:MAG TPA: type IV secretory system conjugative DNA transfer family protein [Planctomycetaceae bacterium]|nr:type IV secretory system conjugative DNA transfer family protein [Planctomycetaceae bacterium]